MMTRFYEVYAIKKIIAPLKNEMAGKQRIYSEFEERNKELQKLIPLVNYLNTESTTPDVQKALIGLQSLYTDNVKVNEIEIKNDRQALIIQIKGIVIAMTYTELQSNFQQLLSSIKKIDGMEISSQKVDLISRNFSIEVKWKI
jgi:hypothetical protein